jgi:hypothetical protein
MNWALESFDATFLNPRDQMGSKSWVMRKPERIIGITSKPRFGVGIKLFIVP